MKKSAHLHQLEGLDRPAAECGNFSKQNLTSMKYIEDINIEGTCYYESLTKKDYCIS